MHTTEIKQRDMENQTGAQETTRISDMENIISTKEAAEILGYVPAALRKLCGNEEKREELGARKIGRDWIFMKEIVQKLAEEKKKKKILN